MTKKVKNTIHDKKYPVGTLLLDELDSSIGVIFSHELNEFSERVYGVFWVKPVSTNQHFTTESHKTIKYYTILYR